MKRYDIWYMKPHYFRSRITENARPDPLNLEATHTHLKGIEIDDGLEQVFHHMQAECWSPQGEARELIRSKGLEHTSMSVGDIVIDETGAIHEVKNFGFEKLFDPRPGKVR